jgi:cell division protein FtsB
VIFKFTNKRYHIFILQLADFMKQSVYSLVSDIAKNSEEDLKTENAVLKLQIELMKWQQTQAITEVARNHGKNIKTFFFLVWY